MKMLGVLIRRARTLLWTAFSILAIAAAVVMGIGQLLIPYSDRYQPRLETWLSQEFGQPVVLESFAGEWTAFGPRISLRGMKLLPTGVTAAAAPENQVADVVIESAALDIRPFNALLPGRSLYNFRVIGADFELTRSEDGKFQLSGFGVSRRGDRTQGSALRDLARVGEVVLQDSSLYYQDDLHGVRLSFTEINGRLNLAGDDLASEIRARLYDERSELVVGDVEAVLLLALGEDQGITGAEWHATARELLLAALQGRLPPNPFLPLTGWFNAELWGTWSAADGHRVRGVTDLRQARLSNEYQDLWLDRVNTRFQWHFRSRKHWDLNFSDFAFDDGQQAWTAPRLAIARNMAEGLGLWISADRLPVAMPLSLARDVMSIYGTPWPRFLPQAAGGSVSDFDLILDAGWRVVMARGELQEASVSDWGRWPDLRGLGGRVALERNAGMVELSGQSVGVTWPRMFREPINVKIPGCRLRLRWGAGWQVGVDDCSLENPDLAVYGGAVISGNEGRPAFDLNVAVTRGHMGQLDPYWPEAVLKDNVKAWLRRGLLAGEIERARVSIHGDMDDWPFRHGEGRFEAVAVVRDVQVDYQPEWPAVRQADVVARFVNSSMDIRGQVGDLAGAAAQSVEAVIDEFATPLLQVEFSSDSDVPAILGFLEATPLRQRIGTDLSRFTFEGAASGRGRISIPLGRTGGELAVDGLVQIDGGRFSDPDLGVAITDIAGRIEFTEEGFSGPQLSAAYRDRPVVLDLKAQAGGEETFRADLHGEFTVVEAIPGFLLEDLQILQRSDGVSPWRASVVVRPLADGSASRAVLEVESDLHGTVLDLPAPFAKSADENWPLMLEFPLAEGRRVVLLDVQDRLALRLELAQAAIGPTRGVLRLGGGFASLPPAGLLRIEGAAGRLDLDHWIDVIVEEMERGVRLGGLTLDWQDVSARELILLDRSFADVDLEFSADESVFSAGFAGEGIDGRVRLTTGAGGARSLSAEFERLALDTPLSSGVEVEADPAGLPALHLYAHSLRYAGIELGETRVEAYPKGNGFHFEKVETSSGQLQIQATGDWLLEEGGYRSDFDIRVASESLGDFLQSLDLASPVQGGQTLAYFNAWWPGSPAAFALSRLNGELEFSVVGGNITGADAGGGRLLGLLSVQALPRRLALDFRDVFDSGLAFEEASGTFRMENGMATTDDVVLRSTAANISVSGATDLVAKQWDQLLTIRPGVGNTLPIIGALAGGPGGAAAGLALQGLLQEPLSEATQVQYSVTGSWEAPVVEAVEVKREGG
jgi:uncharacterized protein (TIGR02099 family)